MCVIGRDTFIGAGNTFTDFNLLAKPIKIFHNGELQEVDLPVIGGCVGHNCRIGSGHTIYPARTIDSDVVLFAKPDRTVITKSIKYEDSDHHGYPGQGHVAQYHDELPQPQERISSKELVNPAT